MFALPFGSSSVLVLSQGHHVQYSSWYSTLVVASNHENAGAKPPSSVSASIIIARVPGSFSVFSILSTHIDLHWD